MNGSTIAECNEPSCAVLGKRDQTSHAVSFMVGFKAKLEKGR